MRGRKLMRAAYVWTVIGIGAFLLVSHLDDLKSAPTNALVFLVFMGLASELVCVDVLVGRGTVSISMAVSMASMILYGPWVGGWVSALGSFRPQDFTSSVSWERRLFNPAQVALSTVVAGLAYGALGGGSYQGLRIAYEIVVLIAAALAAAITNIGLGMMVLLMETGTKAAGMLLPQFSALFPSYLALAPFGLIGAMLFEEMGGTGIAGLLLPLMLARYSFQWLQEMRKTFAQTLTVLIAALEAKDPHTCGHSERVAKIGAAIGAKMRLPDHIIHLLHCIGLLHDVGKIGVKDTILKKEGIFTVKEYIEMQRHPLTGEGIVAGIRTLEQASAWVRHHHERWDGSGFPDGLKYQHIPLGSRIISVADAFDAMTSFRPYKKTQSPQEALEEIRRCKGIQFDPAVVKAFERVIEESGDGSLGCDLGEEDQQIETYGTRVFGG